MAMTLQIIGAGLPRTGTSSLNRALEYLLNGRGYHMTVIPGHPFNLGDEWDRALADDMPDWDKVFAGFTSAVDWPSSMFWRELSVAYPDAPVILSVRNSAETWVQSLEATILPVAREALAPDWSDGRGLLTLFERFTGTEQWDDVATLKAAYERHNAEVRKTIPESRLVEWQAADGWLPICQALELPVPDVPFPWLNKREDWG
jgi:hypothetical protein